ncbi:MAG: ATP-binding protein [Acidimicrobiales bacterium]
MRVRITVVATVIVGLTIAVAGWLLVRSVESALESQVADHGQQQIDDVSEQLNAGVAPTEIRAEPGAGLVQILTADGRLIAVSGGPANELITGAALEDVAAAKVEVPVAGHVGETAAGMPVDVRSDTVSVNGDRLTVVAASPLADVERSVSTLKQALVVGLPLLVALVAAVAWFGVGRALRPVEAIRAEVEAISATTIHRRVPEPGGRDEIDRLARTMNAMLDRLEDGATRQRRFVADASHELRSPIAAIRTQLEVAGRHPDDADWPEVATSVLAEEARLEGLVGDLLALAHDDEGAPPAGALVELNAVVAAGAARARRVPVVVRAVTVADGLPHVGAGDRGALAALVSHLLDNAARHAATAVTVFLRSEDGNVVLRVEDDGAGIVPIDRERVFERFTRLDEGRSRDQGGAGLGLAVVRAVAHRHRGSVKIESSPSGGTAVVVALPAVRAP